ncbi:tetratricopeptide repeat protein [uncultured Draconibacterium sp.]|uniref:tetratricopeptide repeat protein n=1 Tax=uncultured Draconibacterium sp. TaxID=1573823 RepID=UPI0032613495
MKEDRVISAIIIGLYIILALFAVASTFNPGWLQKISEPGKNTEALTFIDNANREMYSGNWKGAAMQYQQALVIDVDNREAYGNLGIALTRLGQFSKAKQCFENVKRLNQGLDSMAQFNYFESIGNLEKSIGDYNLRQNKEYHKNYRKALSAYKKAIVLMPHEPILYYKYAYLLMKEQNDSLAIKYFNEGISINLNKDTYYYSALLTEYLPAIVSGDTEIIENIEQLYQERIAWERFDTESLKTFQKADIRLGNAYFNLGVLYKRNGLKQLAAKQFEYAVKINPQLSNNINRMK